MQRERMGYIPEEARIEDPDIARKAAEVEEPYHEKTLGFIPASKDKIRRGERAAERAVRDDLRKAKNVAETSPDKASQINKLKNDMERLKARRHEIEEQLTEAHRTVRQNNNILERTGRKYTRGVTEKNEDNAFSVVRVMDTELKKVENEIRDLKSKLQALEG